MSTRKKMLVGAVAAVSLVTGVVITTAWATGGPKAQPVQYSVPFTCGWLPPVPPDLDQHLKPGDYATSIKIHNHVAGGVTGQKKVAFNYRMGSTVPPVPGDFGFTIARFRVLEIDCVDIWAMGGLPPGSFVNGAVHIGLQQVLPVSATYTSQTHDDPNAGPGAAAGHSIDVELIEPFLVSTPG